LILLLVLNNMNNIIKAQDYLISFSGTGATNSVSEILVENLTLGINLTLNGDDKLRLSASVTGILPQYENSITDIIFTPNPMKDFSLIQFHLHEPALTIISLYDMSGRKITETSNYLIQGNHTYRITDLNSGLYLITIKSGRFSASSRLMCTDSKNNGGKISLTGSFAEQEKIVDTKGMPEEKVMQYNVGDILKFTGTSGDFSTIITDTPSSDKTVNFNFVACQDASGNNYPIVVIGSAKGGISDTNISDNKGVQIWMGENLKTSVLNDGTAISNATDNNSWSLLSGPAYCWYNNIANEYGVLYNWYAVGTGKLCPSGWRVPTDEEWTALVQYLGGTTNAGGKLKETGTNHWENPNTGATNSSGFTALPGGWRDNSNGTFNEINRSGYWWSSTSSNITNACYRCIISTGSNVYGFMSEVDQKFGFSVRCLKNNE
ncbi:MAG: T9SS type A sorting domain-containing protein, partial [Bacteroidales bacterium]|nr:T9SS type A sorting domain-containing protein [Bacteroidales bacterium]